VFEKNVQRNLITKMKLQFLLICWKRQTVWEASNIFLFC